MTDVASTHDDDLCPCRELLDRLGDRWSALLLTILQDGPAHYGALQRRARQTVSRKVLTQTLRNLERDGLLERTVEEGSVLRVRYALTPLGRSLAGPLHAIRAWTDQHQSRMDQARTAYDDRRPGLGVTELRAQAAASRSLSTTSSSPTQ